LKSAETNRVVADRAPTLKAQFTGEEKAVYVCKWPCFERLDLYHHHQLWFEEESPGVWKHQGKSFSAVRSELRQKLSDQDQHAPVSPRPDSDAVMTPADVLDYDSVVGGLISIVDSAPKLRTFSSDNKRFLGPVTDLFAVLLPSYNASNALKAAPTGSTRKFDLQSGQRLLDSARASVNSITAIDARGLATVLMARQSHACEAVLNALKAAQSPADSAVDTLTKMLDTVINAADSQGRLPGQLVRLSDDVKQSLRHDSQARDNRLVKAASKLLYAVNKNITLPNARSFISDEKAERKAGGATYILNHQPMEYISRQGPLLAATGQALSSTTSATSPTVTTLGVEGNQIPIVSDSPPVTHVDNTGSLALRQQTTLADTAMVSIDKRYLPPATEIAAREAERLTGSTRTITLMDKRGTGSALYTVKRKTVLGGSKQDEDGINSSLLEARLTAPNVDRAETIDNNGKYSRMSSESRVTDASTHFTAITSAGMYVIKDRSRDTKAQLEPLDMAPLSSIPLDAYIEAKQLPPSVSADLMSVFAVWLANTLVKACSVESQATTDVKVCTNSQCKSSTLYDTSKLVCDDCKERSLTKGSELLPIQKPYLPDSMPTKPQKPEFKLPLQSSSSQSAQPETKTVDQDCLFYPMPIMFERQKKENHKDWLLALIKEYERTSLKYIMLNVDGLTADYLWSAIRSEKLDSKAYVTLGGLHLFVQYMRPIMRICIEFLGKDAMTAIKWGSLNQMSLLVSCGKTRKSLAALTIMFNAIIRAICNAFLKQQLRKKCPCPKCASSLSKIADTVSVASKAAAPKRNDKIVKTARDDDAMDTTGDSNASTVAAKELQASLDRLNSMAAQPGASPLVREVTMALSAAVSRRQQVVPEALACLVDILACPCQSISPEQARAFASATPDIKPTGQSIICGFFLDQVHKLLLLRSAERNQNPSLLNEMRKSLNHVHAIDHQTTYFRLANLDLSIFNGRLKGKQLTHSTQLIVVNQSQLPLHAESLDAIFESHQGRLKRGTHDADSKPAWNGSNANSSTLPAQASKVEQVFDLPIKKPAERSERSLAEDVRALSDKLEPWLESKAAALLRTVDGRDLAADAGTLRAIGEQRIAQFHMDMLSKGQDGYNSDYDISALTSAVPVVSTSVFASANASSSAAESKKPANARSKTKAVPKSKKKRKAPEGLADKSTGQARKKKKDNNGRAAAAPKRKPKRKARQHDGEEDEREQTEAEASDDELAAEDYQETGDLARALANSRKEK